MPEGKEITKDSLVAYKMKLGNRYKITSINSMIVAINGLLGYLNASSMKLKLFKVQKKAFYEDNEELTKEEYKRLLEVANDKKNKKLNLLMQTICATGIRVSEHKYITVEALKEGSATIYSKGKMRVIFITKSLRKMLIECCHKEIIETGSIFVTKNGEPMDRSNIWKAMKKLCKDAKVKPCNVYHLVYTLGYYILQFFTIFLIMLCAVQQVRKKDKQYQRWKRYYI